MNQQPLRSSPFRSFFSRPAACLQPLVVGGFFALAMVSPAAPCGTISAPNPLDGQITLTSSSPNPVVKVASVTSVCPSGCTLTSGFVRLYLVKSGVGKFCGQSNLVAQG